MPRKKSANGRSVTSHGYVIVWRPGHHLADARGYVYEHRMVAEKSLGRRLRPGEIVHHIDGDKQNNAPENLEVLESIAHHRLEHRSKASQNRLPGEPNPVICCACGCGHRLEKYDALGRPRRFVSGHNIHPGGSNG